MPPVTTWKKIQWAPPYTGPPNRSSRGEKRDVTLDTSSISDLNLHRLSLSPLQLKAIKSYYSLHPSSSTQTFLPGSISDQTNAEEILRGMGVDKQLKSGERGKWKVVWSREDEEVEEEEAGRKLLFQCTRGIEQEKPSQKMRLQEAESPRSRASNSNTGCLAHVEITFQGSEEFIVSISGIKEHGTSCKALNSKTRVPLGEIRSGKN